MPTSRKRRTPLEAERDKKEALLNSLLLQLVQADTIAKQWTMRRGELEDKVIALSTEIGKEKGRVKVNDVEWTCTVVRPKRTTIIEDKLRKIVGVTIWRKITVRKLDKCLLENAIASGAVSPVDVASVSEQTPVHPYVLVRETNKPKRASSIFPATEEVPEAEEEAI